MVDTTHDLLDFFAKSSKQIADEYKRIRKRAKEDPGTAGDQGEENWAEILKDWLPPYYRVKTKGRIISTRGSLSRQMDLIVLKPSYPPALEDKKVYLAGGVAMAFECKNTLKASHLKEAVSTCAELKRLYEPRFGTPYKELHSPIVYGILAHSHSWKGSKGTTIDRISKIILNEEHAVGHPSQLLDMICIADLSIWNRMITTFEGPNQMPWADWSKYEALYGPRGSAASALVCDHAADGQTGLPINPVGELIKVVIRRLAWEDPNLHALATYYNSVLTSSGGSGTIRRWLPTIYSEKVHIELFNGNTYTAGHWNEWQNIFW